MREYRNAGNRVAHALPVSFWPCVAARENLFPQLSNIEQRRIGSWGIVSLSKGYGIELCKQIRAFDSVTPIIFYSGAAYPTDIQKGLAAGRAGVSRQTGL